jgi:hypothetical protein
MPNHHLLIGGDFNVDFSRSNAHSLHLDNWLVSNDLNNLWNVFTLNDRYTYCDLHQNCFSCIDHWIVSDNVMHDCVNVNATVMHVGANPSKHSPIVFEMELGRDIPSTREQAPPPSVHILPEGIDWHKAKPFITAYQDELNNALDDQIAVADRQVSSCTNWHCDSEDHQRELDAWCSDLVGAALAADHVFPRRTHHPRNRALCGWDDTMRGLKDESIFWHDVWQRYGSAKSGWIFERMREAKRNYMYGVRRLKKRQSDLRASKFTEAIANDSNRDLFKEVKKMSPKPKPASCINGFRRC